MCVDTVETRRKLFYAAMCQLSSIQSDYYQQLHRSEYAPYFYVESYTRRHNQNAVSSAYGKFTRRAHCDWSPLAMPLPFGTNYPPFETPKTVKKKLRYSQRFNVSIIQLNTPPARPMYHDLIAPYSRFEPVLFQTHFFTSKLLCPPCYYQPGIGHPTKTGACTNNEQKLKKYLQTSNIKSDEMR